MAPSRIISSVRPLLITFRNRWLPASAANVRLLFLISCTRFITSKENESIRSFVGWLALSSPLPLQPTILPAISCRIRMSSLISVVWFWFPLSSLSFLWNYGTGAWMPMKVRVRKLEIFPELWDKSNPCLIWVKKLWNFLLTIVLRVLYYEGSCRFSSVGRATHS